MSEDRKEKVIIAKDAVYIIKRDCGVTNNSDCFMVVCLGVSYDDARYNCAKIRRLDDAEYLTKALRLINADKRCKSINEVLPALNVSQNIINQVIQLLCR
jgi:hypothetical protein